MQKVLRQLSQDTGLSLAEVDTFLWDVIYRAYPPPEGADHLQIIEKHLQQILADNWEQIDLANEWGICEEDGEQVGVEFQAGDIGRIDIILPPDERAIVALALVTLIRVKSRPEHRAALILAHRSPPPSVGAKFALLVVQAWLPYFAPIWYNQA